MREDSSPGKLGNMTAGNESGGATAAGARWCAAWSRELSERPRGTAVDVERFVLVELPLPWPAKVEAHPLLQGLEPVAGARVQAIAGAHGCGYRHTVISYSRPNGRWFSSYQRSEVEVARPDLVTTVNRTLRGELPQDAHPLGEVGDLLLCTHGTRDRCCAKLGGGLYRELREDLPDAVRLWRTSHTGGHRFAPTGITFPEGLMWAGLDREVALGVLLRTLPVERASRHLRGCTGVGGGIEQAADAAAFSRRGWAWLDAERKVRVTDDDGARASVEIEYRIEDSVATMTAAVDRGRTLPVPPCGESIDAAAKHTTELIVSELS